MALPGAADAAAISVTTAADAVASDGACSLREAVQSAAEKYVRKARVVLADSNGHIVAQLEPVAPMSDTEWGDVRGEFCTDTDQR